MTRVEVLAAVKRIYEEHGHPDDWGVQVIYVDSMLAHLGAALAAQEGERGGAEVAAAVEAWCNAREAMQIMGVNGDVEELRAILADPTGALATHDAEVWDAGHRHGLLYPDGSWPSPDNPYRADRIEAQRG